MRALHFVVVCTLAACAPQVSKISTRNPDLFEKESDRLEGRAAPAAQPAPEMYVRQRNVAIKTNDKPNETGSLFNPDDERNYLFAPSGPHNIGRFLKINVAGNRAKPGAAPEGAAAKPEGAAATKAKPEEASEDELLKALPDLAPAKKGEPTLLKSFKMQIVHRFDNGDVLARVNRRSVNEDQAADITAEARIPYDRLASGDDLTTDDLLDVKFVESGEGELVERRSSGWEDEYSLRMSGFNEAKSKLAMELSDQKQKLEETKTRLEDRIKTFGAERRNLSKQREEVAKTKAQSEEKVKELEDKVEEKDKVIEEQKSTIEDQQKELEDQKPENKPGDKKEAGGGK